MPSIFDWSTSAGSNTSVDGVNIAENCPAANVNNGIRSTMAVIRSTFATALQGFLAGSSALPIANGGTGATTNTAARTNLGLGSLATASTISNADWSGTDLSVANGGTGASTQSAAFANIAVAGSTLSQNGYLKLANGLHIIWGSFTASANGSTTVSYPAGVSLSSFSRAVISGSGTGTGDQDNNPGVTACSTSGFTAFSARDNSVTCFYIAVGV